jgi:signal transduction histidine kinase
VEDSSSPEKMPERAERIRDARSRLAAPSGSAELLQVLADLAAEATNSEAAWLLLYNEVANQLQIEALSSSLSHNDSMVDADIDFAAARWSFNNRLPLIIKDAHGDERIDDRLEEASGLSLRSSLSAPLISQHGPIGVIETVNKRDTAHYTQEDLAVLEIFNSLAAPMIESGDLRAELARVNAELENLDRMKSDFIAITSHELRTPLGLILGHATFLKEMIPQQFEEQIDVIISSCIRLKKITEDLSAIAHQEQGKSRVRVAPFSVRKMIEATGERFAGAASDRAIELAFDLPEGDPLTVEGEQEKIEVALSNIIDNAISFTDEGGQVGIKAEAVGNRVQVFVADTGIGIPQADIERVFDRFYQVESHLTRRHGGMGLGLSIAKTMIEMHDGQIWCESKEGVGSIFGFSLPRKPRPYS